MYARIIDKHHIEIPPSFKDGIANYNNQAEEVMNKLGYSKVLNSVTLKQGEIKEYIQVNPTSIAITAVKDPTYYKKQREQEYPSIGDMIDAICKAMSGYENELTELLHKRELIKKKYPKD
jgi:hypothetical protein